VNVTAWTVHALGAPMRREERRETAGPGEVLVAVAGCGICHTDLGFYYDGVPTRHPLPLVLGHEIAGTVVEAGKGAESWLGRQVVVPAVIPCGECAACRAGRGQVCAQQVFPGNDVHGGFASHVRVPARGLCPVPDLEDPAKNKAGIGLADLAVVADAVSTPYQAVRRSGLQPGDLAIVVGAGGVGGFCVQIAAALGARVFAVDVDAARLEQMRSFGAGATSKPDDFKALKAQVRALAKEHGVPAFRWKIFECSGAPAGQGTAFSLLEHGGYLSVVGFTPQKIEVRLSNLMAFDATVQGNWGCLPELYPGALDLVLAGKVALGPFTERRPLAAIQESFAEVHARKVSKRIVLCPE
jgi:6-hydroxycyclohex-1-ene-1-carbonyl-CoA dehydrogenase